MIKVTVEGPAEVSTIENLFDVVKTPVSHGETGVFFVQDSIEINQAEPDPRQLSLDL